MPLYEFAIAVEDESDLASGHKRKKAGDVMAVRPHPWDWGKKEIGEYFILIMNRPESFETLRAIIKTSLFEGGRDQQQVDAMEDAREGTALSGLALPEAIAKRSFRIDFDELKKVLPELDMDKVQDKSKIYQPCKRSDQLCQKFSQRKRKGKLRRLRPEQVDTGARPRSEQVVSISLIKREI